ncbi:fructan hydrolase, partial [Lacticaseibacillus paracasei subsp. paracasei Lpp48]
MIFDTKQHYKMYKKGKYWAFAAITLATVSLSSLISNDTTVHADTLNSEANTAKNASNGYQDSPQKTNEQLNQGSTESSALSKTSINPTINANTAANNSTNSGDNQLTNNAPTNKTSSNNTIASSNSSNESTKVNATLSSVSGANVSMTSDGLGTSSSPVNGDNSVTFTFSLSTIIGKQELHAGDTIVLNVDSQGLNYNTVGLSGGAPYFSMTKSPSTNTITLTATEDINWTTTDPIVFSIYGNPLDISGNNNIRTYPITSTYNDNKNNQSVVLTPSNTNLYVKTNGGGGWNVLGSGVYPSDVWGAPFSKDYFNNYVGGTANNTGTYIYSQNAMKFTAGYFNTSSSDYTDGVLKVNSDYVIDQKSIVISIGRIGSYTAMLNPNIVWDADGKGFTLNIGSLPRTGNNSVAVTFFVKTASINDKPTLNSVLTALDPSGAATSVNGTAHGKYVPTSNGSFTPNITASDKTIYSTQKLSESDLLALATAKDQTDGDISKNITITDTGGFKLDDTNAAGTYTIAYAVTNSSGNTSTATSTITVKADQTSTKA